MLDLGDAPLPLFWVKKITEGGKADGASRKKQPPRLPSAQRLNPPLFKVESIFIDAHKNSMMPSKYTAPII